MEIYTDGATSNNGYVGARGGWAWILVDNEEILAQGSGHIDEATNNICELTAIINACIHYSNNYTQPIILYSDSSYCINCYKQKWYENWLKNGWLNSKKQPVANKELWEQLIPFFNNPNFIFEKTKGHSTNKWNNLVDKMAVGEK